MDSGLIKEFEEARDKKEAEKQNGKCKKVDNSYSHVRRYGVLEHLQAFAFI